MPANPTVLHYVGYDDDRGGIVSVVRALASTQRFPCILGVNTGFTPSRVPALPVLELSRLEGETIGLVSLWRARAVAREVQKWLGDDPARVFHGHSRAGLLVALWLVRWGEQRVVVSVHCFGRQRWFYRWAARQFGDRLYWLTPAMRGYYGVRGEGWAQSVPSCIPERSAEVQSRQLRNEVVRLGGVGALTEWKGWHLVLEAMSRLPDEVRRKMSFSHIGSADNTPASREYAGSLQARAGQFGGTVCFLGQQPNSDALLRSVDVLVIPSVNEPFSLAMIEALQAGVPVVRADSGGAVDVIEPGVNGWLFRSGDAGDLSCVLRSLVETDVLAKVQIDREALQRFTAPVVAAQWLEIYRCL